jgi:tetratricopeptide (TPR) repeat protein
MRSGTTNSLSISTGRSVKPCLQGLNEANIGEVLVNQGRLDEAEPLLRNAVRVLRASGEDDAALAQTYLGRLLTARGEFEEAERVLTEAVASRKSVGMVAAAYETLLDLGECLIGSGRSRIALELLAEEVHVAPEEIAVFEAATAYVRARALTDLGDTEGAVASIVAGLDAARARGLKYELARLLLIAAGTGPPFDHRLGTAEPAEEARALLDQLGVIDLVT